jgi:hypothetical protein
LTPARAAAENPCPFGTKTTKTTSVMRTEFNPLADALGERAQRTDRERVSTRTRGACLCGAVTFSIGPPYRWFAYCHCSLCRKHHGSLFGLGLGVARDRLEWRSGNDDVVHYRATAAFERPFCRHCGSTVPAVSHDARYWHVPAGLLDGDPGERPRSHIFVASKSPLHEIADALPQHAAYPPGIDLPAAPRRAAPAMPGTIVGSCACDRVAFSVADAPQRLVNCYCSLCRRRSGAAFTSTLLSAASAFRWLRGEARIRHFAPPASLGSPQRGPPRQYGSDFCADCGSPVPCVSAGAPTIMLPAGAVDTQLAPLPAVHLYVESKAPWVAITDAWPQFAELPPAERFTEFFR